MASGSAGMMFEEVRLFVRLLPRFRSSVQTSENSDFAKRLEIPNITPHPKGFYFRPSIKPVSFIENMAEFI